MKSQHAKLPAQARSDLVSKVHGRYVFKAARMKGQTGFTARAFHDGGPAGTVAEATGGTADDAFAALEAQLESAHADERAARRDDDATGHAIPTASEYRLALGRVAPGRAQWAMLRAHAAAGKDGLTAAELGRAASYKDHSTANLHYGKLGFALAEDLGLEAFLEEFRDDKRAATTLLARPGTPRSDGQFVWVIHPELASAVDAMR